MKKITFIGDIVCDKEMLKHSKNSRGEYDFSKMFEPLEKYFNDSVYVITNLETIIDKVNYTKNTFSFSNPPSLLLALKNIGVNVVSLANNHILDRTEEGIEKTIDYLEKLGIHYFGIETSNTLNINIDNMKIVVLGYTDSTNYHINKVNPKTLNKYKINLLKCETKRIRVPKNIIDLLYHKLSPNIRINIKNLLGKKLKPIIDNGDIDKEYLDDLEKEVRKLKEKNDYLIMYAHMGGQFNIELGNYSKKMIDEFNRIGIDSTIITHPHVIQNKYKNNTFSIGDVVISPRSKFVVWDTLPEYSIVVNYYFTSKGIKKITMSYLICVKDKKAYLKVYPFYKYYHALNKEEKKVIKKQFLNIYKRTFKNKLKIEKEYIVWEE